MVPIIRTTALTKMYGDVRGVVDLDLDLTEGEVFGYIGPNGAGKTTTIRLLLDLIRPTSGRAEVFGLDTRSSAAEIHARTGYLPGELALFDRMTAAELFAWLGRLRGSRDITLASQLAERFDLDTSRRIGDLSSGNHQKVGLVQAFMHRPELLILDEPTASLDPVVQREFRAVVAETSSEGATVLLSSHVLAEVEDICDRVGTVVGGNLRSIETIEEIRRNARRRVRATLEGTVDLWSLGDVPGVSELSVEFDPAADRTMVAFDVVGRIDPVVKTLATHDVVDFVSEPLSLEDRFLEAYDNGVPRSPSAGSIGEVSHVA